MPITVNKEALREVVLAAKVYLHKLKANEIRGTIKRQELLETSIFVLEKSLTNDKK